METKTVSELAELFGVTRQAMNKRVKSLDSEFVEKNEKNITVVNLLGIHELEGLYGKVVTAEAEVVEQHEVAVKADDSAVFEMLSNFMKDKNTEIDRLQQQLNTKDEQLSTKDAQIAEKDLQIKKQQELMDKALTDQKAFLAEIQKEISADKNKGFFSRVFGK
ncbi:MULTISPECIES: DUF536 domain-containing protein [unclassified Lactococcus]|uniref:DUF536 domain-containing protein n=1 Tax=unclassified Lactococcus TaxID=2643510 RepID=UPI0011C8F1B8|nr:MULTISPECIES: DUF536 domain-containing protein [unclassified Lactococcus]MQW23097.1 DUF536 domain-containing protein [Lactococcus sp. dk101]TXK44441.1 DUF536 domain-containing protein [Lactococcus sp. dk310]TXK50250.1 DUF536 domain-containing protein [Lactococcus sp. dk322]